MGLEKRLLRTVAALTLALGAGAAAVAATTLAGCAGNTDNSNGGSDASGTDGSTDGTLDVAFEAAGDDGSGNDVGTGDDGSGGDSGCSGMTRMDCAKCCRMADTTGYKTLVTSELGCACAPALCGPVDGGPDAAPSLDAGADVSFLGIGACTASCGSMPMAGDPVCARCVAESLGGMANPGPCFSEVRDACANDPSCVSYEMCTKGCK